MTVLDPTMRREALVGIHGSLEAAFDAMVKDRDDLARRAYAAEAALGTIRRDVMQAMNTWQRDGSRPSPTEGAQDA